MCLSVSMLYIYKLESESSSKSLYLEIWLSISHRKNNDFNKNNNVVTFLYAIKYILHMTNNNSVKTHWGTATTNE